jgi:hypothetical protein
MFLEDRERKDVCDLWMWMSVDMLVCAQSQVGVVVALASSMWIA